MKVAAAYGACNKCGCALHECECASTEDFVADAKFMDRLDWFLDAVKSSESKFAPCFDCLSSCPAYMVLDSVWDTAWPHSREHRKIALRIGASRGLDAKKCGSQFLCFTCLQIRLGRLLVITDLKDVPINESIRLGYRMGTSIRG